MSKIQIIISFLILTIFAVAGAPQTQTEPDPDDLKQRVIKRLYTDVSDSRRWEIKAEYPELILNGGKPAADFNQVAKNLAMKQVAEFKSSMAENTAEDIKNLPKGMNFDLEVGYTIEHVSEDLISVNFGRYEYTGGAHPNHWTFTLNYDLEKNRTLQLADLFKHESNYLEIISRHSIASIKKQQGEYADEEWIGRGAGPKLENFKSWVVTEKGFKFNFDPYQVGPYAAGDFTVDIPYEKFGSDVRSNEFYPVAMISYVDGNPPNWCRNGHFPRENVGFKLATVKGKKNARFMSPNLCSTKNNCFNFWISINILNQRVYSFVF